MGEEAGRVLIDVNHKWRDLPGLAAIKVWLEANYNCEVLLVPSSLVEQALPLFKPHIACMPHIRGKGRYNIAKQAKQMGSLIAVLPPEGRPYSEGETYWEAGGYTDLSPVDLHFVWNKVMYDAMVKYKTLPPERIKIAGNYRFDYYEYPLQTLVPSRETFLQKYGLNPNQPLVTLATSFTLVRFKNKNQDFLLKDHSDLGITKIPYRKDPIAEIKYEIRFANRTLSALSRVVEAFSEVNFIIKPHPNEGHEIYHKFISDMKKQGRENVTLISQEYIWTLLNATDVHLHRLCTTGIEAWFFKKPSLDLDLVPPPDYFDETAMRGSAYEAMEGCDVVKCEEELIETIKAYINGRSIPSNQLAAREAYIKKWFYVVDGQRTKIYADEIKKLLDDRRPQVTPPTNYERFQLIDILNQSQDRATKKKIDPTGLVDRTITVKDVDEWDQKIRKVLPSADLPKFLEEDKSEKWLYCIGGLLNRGRLFSNQGKYDEAVIEYEKAIALCPKDVNIRANILLQMGNVYFQQGELEKTEEKMKEILCLKPPDKNLVITIVQINYTMGSAYEKKGQLDEAKEKFETVIKLIEELPPFDDRDGFAGGAHFHLGEIYLKLNQRKEAMREFKKCLKFVPGHRKAKENLVNE